MSNEPFEREKVCYEQNFEQFRSLNEQMNRVPTIALLVFAGLANVALGLSCLRIRDVMQSYAEKIRAFNETSFASGRPARATLGRFGDYSMIGIYAVLMVFAALLSWVGAFTFYWPFAAFSAWWGAAMFAALLALVSLAVLPRRGNAA
jgi:hypothetical protein